MRIVHKYICANIYKMYIYTDRQMCYNKAIMEEVSVFAAPPGRRETPWQYQKHSKERSISI